ncbi:hypothetical protein [Chryseobacterium indologenes]|uniref:hypothetical protein n=1 Tax=Chryseobacterium indologenes TaxID=253 RepID=UPI0016281C23|nr:hypothetical protein [Chryseobacterium indologenes]
MKIRKEEFGEVLDFLNECWEHGYEFVAFLKKSYATSKDELFAFSSYYDVREFCHEMTTDRDTYSFLPIRLVNAVMDDAVINQAHLIEKDGIVKVSSMIKIWWQEAEKNSKITNQKQSKTESESKRSIPPNIKKGGPRLR